MKSMKYANREIPLISIVSPAHNEQDILPVFISEVYGILSKNSGYSFEMIIVNDGSTDRTKKVLEKISKSHDNFGFINLEKNVGQQRAIMAGLAASKGKAVIVLDADMQDPPRYISDFLRIWQEGAEVVYGRRISRKDTYAKRFFAFLFYRMANVFGMDLFIDTGDFYLLDRRVVLKMLDFTGKKIFLRGMISWGGHRSVALNIERQARASGKSSYNIKKMLQLAYDSILCRYAYMRVKK